MSDRIELAFDRVRALDPEQQSHVAELLEDIVLDHASAQPLSEEEEHMIDAAIASIDACRGVSGADLDAFWKRHRE